MDIVIFIVVVGVLGYLAYNKIPAFAAAVDAVKAAIKRDPQA